MAKIISNFFSSWGTVMIFITGLALLTFWTKKGGEVKWDF